MIKLLVLKNLKEKAFTHRNLMSNQSLRILREIPKRKTFKWVYPAMTKFLNSYVTGRSTVFLRKNKIFLYNSHLLKHRVYRYDIRIGWHKFRYGHFSYNAKSVRKVKDIKLLLYTYSLLINNMRQKRKSRQSLNYKYSKVEGDSVLLSEFLYKMLRILLRSGGLAKIERHLYGLFLLIWLKRIPGWLNWYIKFLHSVNVFLPGLEIKNVRRGGKVYQIPITIFPRRQRLTVLRFLLRFTIKRRWGDFVKERTKYTSSLVSLLKELLQFGSYRGLLVKQLVEIYKIAFDNRMFSHFRWGY